MTRDAGEPTLHARAFVVAILVSAVLILSAPYVGDFRAWLSRSLGPNFVRVINGSIAAIALAATVFVLARIRERRARRFGLLAGAAIIAAIYAPGSADASAETRAVERFHVVEYGCITFLCYRAWRAVGDASVLPLTVLSALLIGTADEGLQWLVPGRYGELRDIFLNAASIAAGLLVSMAIDPPVRLSWELRRRSRVRLVLVTAVVLAALAAFVDVVHLGHLVEDDDDEVAFRSRYTSEELAALSAARATEWGAGLPVTASFSVEDQFLTEGLWHVQVRNTKWSGGAFGDAWGENRILEKYFAPVLAAGQAWPAEQRADAAQRAKSARARYDSHAERLEIWTWPRGLFWAAFALILLSFVLGLLSLN